MINNHIDSDKEQKEPEDQKPASAPNESTGIYIRGFVKISDPESGQVFVETAN